METTSDDEDENTRQSEREEFDSLMAEIEEDNRKEQLKNLRK
jgi:hypothetical protein